MARNERIEVLKNWILERYADKKNLGNAEKTDRKYTLLKQYEKLK